MVPALPSLLKHAVLVLSEDPKPGQRSKIAFHWMVAPLVIGNRHYIARLGIKQLTTGHKHYEQELGALDLEASAATGPEKEPGEAAETVELGRLLARVNLDGMLRKAKALGTLDHRPPERERRKGTPILIKISRTASPSCSGGCRRQAEPFAPT